MTEDGGWFGVIAVSGALLLQSKVHGKAKIEKELELK